MGLWWRNIGVLGSITEVIVAIIKSKRGMVLVEVPRARTEIPDPRPLPDFVRGVPLASPICQNRGDHPQIPDAAQKTNVDTPRYCLIYFYAKGPKPPLLVTGLF